MINSVWKVCKQLKNSLNWFKPKLKTNIQIVCTCVYVHVFNGLGHKNNRAK